MKNSSLLHRIWWHHGDGWPYDEPWVPKRINRWLGERDGYFPPLWIWRPYCWLHRKHEDDSYGECVYCRKAL